MKIFFVEIDYRTSNLFEINQSRLLSNIQVLQSLPLIYWFLYIEELHRKAQTFWSVENMYSRPKLKGTVMVC